MAAVTGFLAELQLRGDRLAAIGLCFIILLAATALYWDSVRREKRDTEGGSV